MQISCKPSPKQNIETIAKLVKHLSIMHIFTWCMRSEKEDAEEAAPAEAEEPAAEDEFTSCEDPQRRSFPNK